MPRKNICDAKTRKGTPCQNYAMTNGRGRFHGGMSTGAKTPEGKLRSKMAKVKHGAYTKEALAERKALRNVLKMMEKCAVDQSPENLLEYNEAVNALLVAQKEAIAMESYIKSVRGR